jgi:hypothetical protein
MRELQKHGVFFWRKMGEWTNLNLQEGVEFRTNAIRSHVTISTIYGEYTASVVELRRKVNDPHVLIDVKKMFRAMLDYYENEENR